MKTFLILAILFMSVSSAVATPRTFVFQGKVFGPDEAPLEAPSVVYTVQVLSSLDSCLLFEEVFTLNMTDSGGVFNLSIGTGVSTGNGKFSDVALAFDNNQSIITGLDCESGTTYTPSPEHTRKIRLTFDDGNGPVTLPEDHIVESMPYARESYRLEGHAAADFLQQNISSADLSQTNLENVFDGGPNQTSLMSLIAGTSSLYAQRSGNGASTIPSFPGASPPPAPSPGDIWYNSTTNSIVYYDGSTVQNLTENTVDSVFGRTGVIVAATGDYTASQVNNVAAGSIAATTVQGAINELDLEKLAKSGDSMSGALSMGSNKITNVGTPTVGTDATTKSYVDTAVTGLTEGDLSYGSSASSPNDAVFVDNAGNVGIGTTSPDALLDVAGVIEFSGAGRSRISNSNVVGREALQLRSEQNNTLGAGMNLYGDGDSLFPGETKFFNGNSTSMTISSTGNVGIGTTSPIGRFHVLSTASGNYWNNDRPAGQYGVIRYSTSGTRRWELGVDSAAESGSDLGSNFNFWRYQDDGTGLGAALTIERDSGNVGIGTTAPAGKLDVLGGDFLLTASVDDAGDVIFRENDGFQLGRIWTNTTTDVSGLYLSSGDNIADIAIHSSGNVGIGITAPAEKLHVNGNIRGTQLCIGGDCRTAWPSNTTGTVTSIATGTGLTGGAITSTGTISIANNGVGTTQIADNAVALADLNTVSVDGRYVVNSGDTMTGRLFISSGSDVGLAGGGYLTLGPETGTNVSIDTNEIMARNNGSGAPLYIQNDTGSGDTVLNQNSGNVGIGISNPGERLQVNGNVQATNFVATSDRRLKTNIETIPGLELITQMRGVTFDWKSNGEPEVGLIAQEVEAVVPDLVVTNKQTGLKAVKYQNIVSPLIEAVKDLYALILEKFDLLDTKIEKNHRSAQRGIASLNDRFDSLDISEKANAELESKVKKQDEEIAELKKQLKELKEMLENK